MMTSNISPPKTLDEIPEKILSAWISLGLVLTKEQKEDFSENWRLDNGYLGIEEALTPIVSKAIPADSFPHWLEPIQTIVNNDPNIEDKARNIKVILENFLGWHYMYTLLPLWEEITGSMIIDTLRVPKYIPQVAGEYGKIADKLVTLDDNKLAIHALLTLAKETDDAKLKEARDAALIKVLPSLSTDVLSLGYPENPYGGDAAEMFCGDLKDATVQKPVLRFGSGYMRSSMFRHMGKSQYQMQGVQRDNFWNDFLEEISLYADEFAHARPSYINQEVIQTLWKSQNREGSDCAVSYIFEELSECDRDDEQEKIDMLIAVAEQMLVEDEQKFASGAAEQIGSIDLPELHHFWKLKNDVLAPEMLRSMLSRIKDYDLDCYFSEVYSEGKCYQEYSTSQQCEAIATEILRDLLLRTGDRLSDQKPAELAKIMYLVNNEKMFIALTKPLQALAAKSKPFRASLPLGLKKIAPRHLDDMGWVEDKRKGVRDAALDILIAMNVKDAIPFIQNIRENPKTAKADKDRVDFILTNYPK